MLHFSPVLPFIECVPNFSEGRDPAVLRALEAAITAVPGVSLLDVHADRWHHRSVFTFVGPPDPVAEAAFQGARAAAERINLVRHEGEHPRMGAADVVPFVPLDDATMADCVRLAERVGRRIGEELDIPVFLYGAAARRPGRTTASDVRLKGFEALHHHVGRDPRWTPDFGPPWLHPTAGGVAVGARRLLVAFNLLLDSDDLALARRIARTIRTSGGGLPAVQARGFLVDHRAQVSANLLDPDVTPPLAVFTAVQRRAAEAGVAVVRSELVGLVPERAVPAEAAHLLKLDAPLERHLLERRIGQLVG